MSRELGRVLGSRLGRILNLPKLEARKTHLGESSVAFKCAPALWSALGQSLRRPVVGSEGSVDHTVWSLHVLSVEWRQEIHGQAGMVSPEELHTRGGQRGQLSSGLEEETWWPH